MKTAASRFLPRMAMMAAALLTACGTAVDTEHPGVPLATVTGQITTDGQVDVGDGLRLALVWYPSLAGSGARGLVTQDVTYQGNFPLQYEFNIYSPPPAAALADWSAMGGPKRAAVGLLLAYRDLNGNGTLDTIKADGVVHDKVLGASVSVADDEGYTILYVDDGQFDGSQAPAGLRALQQGFNLVKGETLVPLTTPIPIALFDRPENNLLICDGLYSFDTPTDDSGTNLCGMELPPVVAVHGGISLIDDTFRVDIVVGGDAAKSDVSLKLGAREFTGRLEGDKLLFELEEPNNGFLVPGGTYPVTLTLDGTDLALPEIRMPGAFVITAPAAGATLIERRPLTASWSPSQGADGYEFELDGKDYRFLTQVEGESLTTDSAPSQGTATLRISAIIDNVIDGPLFSAELGRTIELTFEK